MFDDLGRSMLRDGGGGTHGLYGGLGCGFGAVQAQWHVVSGRGQVHVEGGEVALTGTQGVVPAAVTPGCTCPKRPTAPRLHSPPKHTSLPVTLLALKHLFHVFPSK